MIYMNNRNYHILINNIDLLNTIKVNDKLLLFNNVLSIDNNKCCGQLYRWYYRQNRERIYIFILGLINDIELEILIFNMYDRKMSKYKLHNINIQSNETCFVIFNKLVILQLSLDKLKKTYKRDKLYVRKLVLLQNKIRDITKYRNDIL